MGRKRSTGNSRKPGKGSRPVVDREIVRLAAALEAIAAMDSLPLIPFPPHHKRRRRCAT